MTSIAKRFWTAEEEGLLREWYSSTEIFVADMAKKLGRPISSVYTKARALRLERPLEIRSIGGKIGSQRAEVKAHQFTKGHIPANKGKKMTAETYSKVSRTMFSKGHTPWNHHEVGSERVNKDGYIEVKVAEPNKWKAKHRLIWEELHGPIKKGYNVQFRDGNPKNVAPENLYLISRQEQMRDQNSLMARYPKELQDIIRLRGSIKRQMTLYNKKQQRI